MAWDDDIATRLQSAGVGTIGTDIFVSTSASIPTGPGPYLLVRETQGTAPIKTQNKTNGPTFQRPSAQLVVHGLKQREARAMAKAAYLALFVVNSYINGVWYLEISPVQEPFDLGLDDSKRARVAFNVSGVKNES